MKYLVGTYLMLLLQGPQQTCLNLLEAHFIKMKSFSELEEGKTYFLAMKMFYKDNPLREGGSDLQVESSLFVNKEQYVFESSTISVYQDSKDAFVVIHPQKKIIRRNSFKINHTEQYEKLIQLQESILTTNQRVECRPSNTGVEVMLIPDQLLTAKEKIRSVSFLFDEKESLKEVGISYVSTHQFLHQRMVYESIDLDVKNWKNKTAYSYVLRDDKRAVEQFSSYEIIDNRSIDR